MIPLKKSTLNAISLFILATGIISIFVLIYLKKYDLIRYFSLGLASIPFVYFCIYKQKYLLFLCILFVPLAFRFEVGKTGSTLSFPSELIAAILFLLFVAQAFFKPVIDKKILLHPITIFLIIDSSLLLLTSAFSTMPDVSIKRVIIRVVFVSVYYVVVTHLLQKKQYLTFPLFLYIAGLLPVIFLVWKSHAHYNFDPRAAFEVSQPFYNEHTVYGACIAFVLPFLIITTLNFKLFSFKKITQPLLITLLILLLVAEFLTFSRAAIISLAVALLFYLSIKFLRIKLWQLLLILIAALCVTYSFKDELYNVVKSNEAVSNDGNISNHFKSVTNVTHDASNMERINRWICAYRMFEQSPLTGLGPGTYQFEYSKFQTRDNMTYISTNHGDRGNAHSEYLTYLAETGIVGFLLFVTFVFYSIHFGLKLYYKLQEPKLKLIVLSTLLGLSTFFFHGVFNSFIDQDEMASLVFMSLAVMVAIDVYHKKSLTDTINAVT